MKSASLTSKLCTLRRMLRAVLSALFPLQHLLSPPAGNSSILAFLLSLLRMLSNTLLTLACTRSKRIQLENRFGSSLRTPSLSPCFDAASFCRLFVKRVVQPFVSSFLCEVFFSGNSLGMFRSCIFDHSLKSFVRQSRPFSCA